MINITEELNIEKWCVSNILHNDPLVNAIENYKNHLSIIKIKSSFETTELFDFNFVSINNISKIINLLDHPKKASSAIPAKIVK